MPLDSSRTEKNPFSNSERRVCHEIYSLQKYNTLYKDGEPLDDVEGWEAGIDDFFEWLQDEFPNGAILVAHNGFNCDAKQIVRDFQSAGYSDEQIEDTVIGFVDTMVAFNKTFRGNLNGSVGPRLELGCSGIFARKNALIPLACNTAPPDTEGVHQQCREEEQINILQG